MFNLAERYQTEILEDERELGFEYVEIPNPYLSMYWEPPTTRASVWQLGPVDRLVKAWWFTGRIVYTHERLGRWSFAQDMAPDWLPVDYIEHKRNVLKQSPEWFIAREGVCILPEDGGSTVRREKGSVRFSALNPREVGNRANGMRSMA